MSLFSRLVWVGFVSIGLVSCSSGSTMSENRAQARVVQPRPAPPARTNIPKASPEKLFEVGKKFYEAKEFNKAFDYFSAAASGWAGKPRELEAQVWANRSLLRAGRYHETADLASQLLKTRTWSEPVTMELTNSLYRSQEAIGDVLGALSTALTAQSNPALAKESESYRMKTFEIIESKLTFEELEKVSSREEFGALRARALYRLGQMALENRDTDSAQKNFAKAMALSPQSDVGLSSREMLEQIEALRRVQPKTIGVVLPMSGRYASISQKTLRGVQMGLGLYNNYPSSFKLAVVDSEGNPDNARRGVERLAKEDNAIAVIGSVLSKTAPAVAAKTAELGIPSIALSQKAGITEVGPNVFRNSLTSEMQVRYLVKTAMEELGMKRFAILFPNDRYGVEFANLFWDEVLARGGVVVGAQTYSNKETDFRYPVQRLVGTYYVEGRLQEYNLRLKEWSKAQTKKSVRNAPEDLLPPIVDFDGVFIPDNVKAMGQISAMLSFSGVKGVRLLGTNLWNVPGIAKRAGHFADNLLFVDSFVSTEPRFMNSSFVRDYKMVFGEEPGIFEIQGYDSALLLRQLITQGATGRESLTRALATVNNFPGAVGPLSVTSEHEIMRPLVALTLNGSHQVVPFTPIKRP